MAICTLCNKEGETIPVERTLNDGVITRFMHKDGSRDHTWTTYRKLEDLVKQPKSKPSPKIIKCPRCGDTGRVNLQQRYIIKRRNKKTRPEWTLADTHPRYIVTHEKLPGDWGHRVAKRRRCCIISQKDRDYVLKKLGRYISPH